MTTLFIEADELLLVFPSIDRAERYLEAVDVRAGVYPRAFGQAGERFSIMAEGERVVIRPEGPLADPDGLRALLQRSLDAVGETMPRDADLPMLVAAAEVFGKNAIHLATASELPFPCGAALPWASQWRL